jgi:hypothetical protein
VKVDALVALQPDQPGAGRPGERLGHLSLAHAGLALEQQRLLEVGRQGDGNREAPVSEVPLARQGLPYGWRSVESHAAAAVSNARRVNTRARWRL